jgi:hypothetical protein
MLKTRMSDGFIKSSDIIYTTILRLQRVGCLHLVLPRANLDRPSIPISTIHLPTGHYPSAHSKPHPQTPTKSSSSAHSKPHPPPPTRKPRPSRRLPRCSCPLLCRAAPLAPPPPPYTALPLAGTPRELHARYLPCPASPSHRYAVTIPRSPQSLPRPTVHTRHLRPIPRFPRPIQPLLLALFLLRFGFWRRTRRCGCREGANRVVAGHGGVLIRYQWT